MSKFQKILKILIGNDEERIVFGLISASKIFNETNGRYTGDATKAVPFAILATASLLGAEITLQSECETAIKEAAAQTKEEEIQIAEKRLTTNQEVERLLKQKEIVEFSLKEAERRSDLYIRGLVEHKTHVQSTLEFFTV